MYSVEKLQSALDALKTKRSQITGEGWYLQHCWLVQVKPGGNARTDRKYWQVRSRQPMFEGKTLKHLKPDEVEDYKAAIARGRQLKQIDRQIKKLQQQLERLLAKTTNTTRQTSPPTPLVNKRLRPLSSPLVGENERGGEGSHTPPFPIREGGGMGGLGLSEPNSIKSKVTFTDLTEQERLVKEVLAKSQELRDSLQQSGVVSQKLRRRYLNLRNGHPRLQ
ncbi:MAG: hypothetical protein F6K28_15390 [Microcoleus sp. SIO2G3]|nr:hypothetical protein [Microcoleus sp. SIO2G3]